MMRIDVTRFTTNSNALTLLTRSYHSILSPHWHSKLWLRHKQTTNQSKWTTLQAQHVFDGKHSCKTLHIWGFVDLFRAARFSSSSLSIAVLCHFCINQNRWDGSKWNAIWDKMLWDEIIKTSCVVNKQINKLSLDCCIPFFSFASSTDTCKNDQSDDSITAE